MMTLYHLHRKKWLQSAKNDFNRVFNANKVFDILLKQGKLKFEPDEMLQIIRMVRENNQMKTKN